MMDKVTGVLLVDDDPLVRSSLKVIVEADRSMRVVGMAGDGHEAVAQFSRLQPDILLMDIRMGEMDGLAAGARILESHPDARILFLTTFADDEYIIKALRMGAHGYLLKQDFESIVPALKAVMAGQSVFGDTIMARIPFWMGKSTDTDTKATKVDRGFQTPESLSLLTANPLRERERELIRLVAEGLNNREIAARLFLGEGTVRNQLSVILEKLGLRDRTQLVIFYYKNRQAID